MTYPTPHPYGAEPNNRQTVKFAYFIFLAGLIFPILPLVSLVMAYVNRGQGDPVADNHYRWIIRTFWMAFAYALLGVVLSLVFIGFLVFAFLVIWNIVRLVKGLQALGKGQPIPNVETWVW